MDVVRWWWFGSSLKRPGIIGQVRRVLVVVEVEDVSFLGKDDAERGRLAGIGMFLFGRDRGDVATTVIL